MHQLYTMFWLHIYCKLMWLLLLLFRDARLYFGKYYSQVCSFSLLLCLLFSKRNGISAIRWYDTIWWHQSVVSVAVRKRCCWIWLCWSLKISSRYLLLTFAVPTLYVNGCVIRTGYDSLVWKWPSRDLASPSKCMTIACLKTHFRSYLHSRPAGESLRSYLSLFVVSITVTFSEKPSDFLLFRWFWFHCPAFDWNDLKHQRFLPCAKNENEHSIFEPLSMTMLIVLQKTGLISHVWVAKTRFSTIPQENHRTLEWYKNTFISGFIS